MAGTPPMTYSGRVLIIDDNPGVRESMADILRLSGYEISEADFDDAPALLGKGEWDLVLLDLGLPFGNGLKLLGDVEGATPVILISGSDEPEVEDPRVSLFLPKPIHPARLLEEVALYIKKPA